jgi:hypothetical protein
MIYKILIVFATLFVGCGEVDKEELKALNAPLANKQKKSISFEVNSSLKDKKVVADTKKVKLDIAPVVSEKSILKKEKKSSSQVMPIAVAKSEISAEDKYKLALVQIRKERETAMAESELELSLAKLENTQKLLLKEKELELSRTKAKSEVDIARMDLMKVKEGEKTKQLIQTQTHTEALIDSANKKELDEKKILLDAQQLRFYKIAAAILAFLIFLFLLLDYFSKKRANENRLKMHEDELSYKLQMQMVEHQSKNIDKMLEIVTNQDLAKNVQKELLYAIKESQKKTFVFDKKPKRSLIFRS